MASEPIGIILLNLGGPEKPEDVEPFLYNLFSDRKIIRLGPWFMQKPLARLIARRRAPKSRAAYGMIGGGSPLARITADQGMDLVEHLSGQGDFRVVMAMRYWQPTAVDAIKQLRSQGVHRAVALPLYPHYSVATTGSSLDDLRQAARVFPGFELAEIESWPVQPSYIDCLAAKICKGLDGLAAEQATVVYSAHSLPKKFIDEGDPYLDQILATIAAVEAKTKVPGVVGFQSRSGPVEWLSPSTPEVMERLAGEGCRFILMVPVSFVSDHVETLYEIDIMYREQAEMLGIRLARTESLNRDPLFIRSLGELVVERARQARWLAGSGQ